MLNRKILSLIFCCCTTLGFSQNLLPGLEDSIRIYRDWSIQETDDSLKLEYNDRIVGLFKQALEQEAAQAYDFTKLERFSILKAKDVTVVTWNLELSDFNNNYFGVIGYRDKRKVKSKVLLDRGIKKEGEQKTISEASSWPGALYYEMVPFKRKNGLSFLLLGWRGENRLESYKVAEVLSISKAGVNFGLPILELPNGDRLNRLVVHYPSNLNYSMKYDEKEKQFYYNRLGLIDESKGPIFNNLTPTYTFDAFKYQGGRWLKEEKISVVKPQ